MLSGATLRCVPALAAVCLAARRTATQAVPPGAVSLPAFDMVERTFTSDRAWTNAFLQVDVDVVFTHAVDPSLTITLPALVVDDDNISHFVWRQKTLNTSLTFAGRE